MKPVWIAALAALALPLPAHALQQGDAAEVQDAAASASTRNTPPQRIRNLQLRPGEACPEANGDEIVVCGRIDPDELYRIPERLRETPPSPANTAWGVRSERLMEDGRVGLPDSCSPVGTGGLTGCNRQLLDQWGQGRRELRRNNSVIPGGR